MIGEVISGRYRITARIGSGGAGEVYEAEDLELPRKAAIKLLAPIWGSNQQLRQRFLREAEALSLLDHPHICTIYKAGETDSGRLYIAMAHYDGEDLSARLAAGAMVIPEALSCAIAITDGMELAHRKGFLHRDLKPGNVLITEDGIVKILDFGLAKVPDRTQMTETGVTMGTLAYASPEQVRGEKLDARTDIYALGVLLYQMVTGTSPFAASSAVATLQMVMNHQPAAPRKLRSDIPRRLDQLILRCIEKTADQRPESMAVVQDELIEMLAEISPSTAARQRAGHVENSGIAAPPPRRRRRLIPSVGVAAAIALLLWLVGPPSSWFGPDQITSIGALVVPFSAEGSDEASALAAGVCLDVTGQLMRLSDLDAHRWVVPAGSSMAMAMENARSRYGVDAVLNGIVRANGGELTLTLNLHDVLQGGALATASWRLNGEEAPDLLAWLSEVLDIPLEVQDRARIEAPGSTFWPARRDYYLGLSALKQNDPALAVEHLAAAHTADQQFGAARLSLASALCLLGSEADQPRRVDQAESLLNAYPEPRALLGQHYAVLAETHKAHDDQAGAAHFYNLAINHNPANPDYRRKHGAIWMWQAAYASAEAVYLEAVDVNPGYYGAWEDLGFLYYLQGRNEDCIRNYSRVIELAPSYEGSYNLLGAAHYGLEQWDQATEMFERSFALRQNVAACSNLGTLYYMNGRFEDAAEMYEWAWEYDQSDHMLLGNRASALRWVPGREEESVRLFDEAAILAQGELEKEPNDGVTLAFLAGYQVLSHPDQALDVAGRALREDPENPEVLYRVAVVHEEAGDRTRALTLLGAAIERGHPLSEIKHERLLDDLRDDPRYQLLLP